jgi:hypothetical protein
MNLLCTTAAVFAVFALSPTDASAWGKNGHRIVGDIAQETLTPQAEAGLEAVAGHHSLALLSTWPDFIRSFSAYDCFKPWHFLTVEDGQEIDDAVILGARLGGECDRDVFNDLNMPNNILDAINYFEAVLRGDNQKADDFSELLEMHNAEALDGSIQLTALALLVHLVGDIHQPLHVGRGPDRGGNTITVEWFDEYVTLHELWDTELIEHQELSFTEFSDFLRQEFEDGSAVALGGTVTSWAQESVDIRYQVYEFDGNSAFNVPRLGYVYAANNNMLLKERLYSGGMRLGALLNQIYE